MPEYIDKDKLLNAIECIDISNCTDVDDIFIEIERTIDEQPTADVVEVRYGKWKSCFEDWRKQIEGDECSACGFQHYGTNIRDYPFCPNCGSKMDGKEYTKNDT